MGDSVRLSTMRPPNGLSASTCAYRGAHTNAAMHAALCGTAMRSQSRLDKAAAQDS
jgi:hypothetical protein